MSTSAPAGTALKVHSHQPYNAETMLDRLVASFITPQCDLYVRTHGEVQHLDEASHRLKVTGQVARALELSVADLRSRFRARSIVSGLQVRSATSGGKARHCAKCSPPQVPQRMRTCRSPSTPPTRLK